MSNFLKYLEDQPEFPKQDLTESNAELLSMVLANSGLLNSGHRNAEVAYAIFTGTHKPLVRAAENIFVDPDRVRDVEFGIRAFEAATLFVGAFPVHADLIMLEQNINGIVQPSAVTGVREYFEEANEAFHNEMPHTVEVIKEVSARFVGSPQFAVLGSAVARQFELHNIKD